MGTRVQHIVFDDLDHSTDNVGTYRFALEGVDYEIDLSETHLGDLRAALAPFITAGRRQPRTGTRRRTAATPAPGYLAAVRAWWQTNGDQLALPPFRSHGRIPATVRTAYGSHH